MFTELSAELVPAGEEPQVAMLPVPGGVAGATEGPGTVRWHVVLLLPTLAPSAGLAVHAGVTSEAGELAREGRDVESGTIAG